MPKNTINRPALVDPLPVDCNPTIHLGHLALRLGQVDRVTYHRDGVTRESDTDHTVMLGLVAVDFASRYMPSLDLGLIAILSLVHDLPEVYAGDTSTLRITAEQRAAKRLREEDARRQLTHELPSDSILPEMMELYEKRACREVRYVWAMDKLLPKITHILNDGVTLREQGMTPELLQARYAEQLEELAPHVHDFPELLTLRAQLIYWLIVHGLHPPFKTVDR